MGSSRQTTTQTRDPWAPAQPALNTALGGAMDAFNNTYQGTGVADMNPLVTQGQNQMIANANSGQLGNLANTSIGNLQGIAGNGGLSRMQTDAAGGINSALGNFNSLMGTATNALQPYATGQYLNQRNPYLDRAVSDSMQRASEAVNRQFSAAGRYGSGAQSGALGRELGTIANNAYMQDYQQQQANQLNALGLMGNFAGAGLSGNLSGQNAIAGIGQQGIANTGSIAGAIPGLSQAQNVDAGTLMGVGGQQMDYAQSLIDAANQNPWTRAGNLAQIAGGIGGLGGTATGTTTTSNPLGAVGGVLAGLGGLGNLFTGFGRVGGFSGLFGR